MEKKELKTIYNGEISKELLLEYLKRIYAGIPYGIKANLGGKTQLTVKLFGVSIKENEEDKNYLKYENNSFLGLTDAYDIVYRGISNRREFGKVVCDYDSYVYPLITYCRVEENLEWINDVVKPYLRPLSNITDGEMRKAAVVCLGGLAYQKENGDWYTIQHDPMFGEIEQDFDFDYFSKGYYGIKNVEFLTEHHFDYSGLIEKNMALAAENQLYGF